MAIVNRILCVLILVLAGGALFLSWKLFERRDEFRGRADKLATAVAEMVRNLDRESQTNKAGSINFKPSDPSTGTPESGTLGWAAYHEAKDTEGTYAKYQGLLDEARKLSNDINEQRNNLATQMGQVATDLEVGEGVLDPNDLRNLKEKDKATKAMEQLTAHVKAMATRDTALIKAVVAAAAAIGHEVNEADFKQRKETTTEDGNVVKGDFRHQMALTEFQQNVTNLSTRCNDYAKTLGEVVTRIPKHTWETEAAKLGNEREYATALTSLMNDLDGINEKLAVLEKTKLELDETKLKLEETADDLSAARTELLKSQDKVAELEAKLRVRAPGEVEETVVSQDTPIPDTLEGTVLQVNRNWNYVILDLGQTKIRENVEMLVARQDRLIARVQVSKVLRRICVAEILPGVMTGEVQENDRVIMPSR